jgi:hypothetical protein
MSTSTNPIDQIAQELAASNSKIGPRAVLSNLIIMLGLSVCDAHPHVSVSISISLAENISYLLARSEPSSLSIYFDRETE